MDKISKTLSIVRMQNEVRLGKALEIIQIHGIYKLLQIGLVSVFRLPINLISLYYFKIVKSKDKFQFQNYTYDYFYNLYNTTWDNERAVEIPIIKDILDKHKGKSILEVGNVYSFYFNTNHDILDKYEIAKGIINTDITEYKPTKKYDLIFSISTIEHVGFDESIKDPKKIQTAIDNLKQIKKDTGKIIITVPVGYNHSLNEQLKSNALKYKKITFLKRISRDNKWVETKDQNIYETKYNMPYNCANAIAIIEY